MPWYAASVVLRLEFETGEQDEFPLREDVFLVRAATRASARMAAVKLARKAADSTRGSTIWRGRASTWVFAGVRQLIQYFSNEPDSLKSGTDVSFVEWQVDALSLRAFCSGKTVRAYCATGRDAWGELAAPKNKRKDL